MSTPTTPTSPADEVSVHSAQPHPVHTDSPTNVEDHFENLLHHIIPAWGGNGKDKALELFRRWHTALVHDYHELAELHHQHQTHPDAPTTPTE